MYMRATGKANGTESTKIATFLWLIGRQAREIYNTLFPNDGTENGILGEDIVMAPVQGENAAVAVVNQRTLNDVLKAFDGYCIPKKNTTMESFKFNNILQKEKQPFAEFETELRKQIQFCDFNSKCECGKELKYEERMLKDRIIIGVEDKKLQLKLLDGKDEPLNKVIEMCKTYEAAKENKVMLNEKNQSSINSMVEQQPVETVNAVTRRCYNCGNDFNANHLQSCKAKDINCRSCGRKGHFQRFCKSKGQQINNNGTKPENKIANRKLDNNNGKQQQHSIDWGSSGNFVQIIDGSANGAIKVDHIYRINSSNVVNHTKRWYKEYQIGNQVVKFKLDTGSDVDCIPVKILKKLKVGLENENEEYSVFDYNGNKVNVFGTVKLKCIDTKLKMEHVSHFIVVDDVCEPILGLESSERFGLVKRTDVSSVASLSQTREDFLENNCDVFEGLGKFPGTFSINMRENSKPVLHYKKRIPNSLWDKLKLQLDKMVRDGIISPVDYPTDWVNNLQIVEKPNSNELRICLDPKPLNECIRREHFLIPTIDDLTSGLAEKRVFSVLDLKSGYWQMELDEVSSDLTTFMTPFGRYKFNRVPFGLNFVPELFQREMFKMLGDIEGVIIYFDDVGICAKTEEEHDRIMERVLERARKYNIKFNPEKIQYRKREVKFMGHILFEGKFKANLKYRDAILKMKKPSDKAAVSRFLGILKYLAKFIPNLSKQSAHLRNLTRNDVAFEWTENHDLEFKKLLEIVTSEPVLAIYDPNLPIIVQTDASKDGLGCVIVQNGHPVAYASRTLSKSEQKWAQIEKELLAIVFSCQRFHYFLYGREFTVESDHKPLETLVKRDIDDVTMRLQRMLMALLKYPKMTVVYKPGKEMLVADCLSRAQLSECHEDTDLTGIIHSVTKSACLSEQNYNLYRSIIERDEFFLRICRYVENGWPNYQLLDDLSRVFYKVKDELHFENGLLFRDHRLVIPKELQGKLSKWLHAPHLGIEKTLARARMHYYWPNMNGQIKELVASCAICEKFTRNNQKEELVQEELPRYPFQIVSMDVFEYTGQDFLSVIDAYSGYVIVEHLSNKTARHIVGKLKSNFNKIGYPTVVKSDNVPFNAREFEEFASDYNIIMKFSSPRYPQSNGLAEKGVAIAKNILKRCVEERDTENYQYRILEYNTTPVASMRLTPAQLFFGRVVKTRMPISDSLLHRDNISEETIQNKIKEKREKQKYYYDRNAKALPVLGLGDLVIFKKNGKEWNYGTIVGNVSGRSYIIKDNFDNHFRRNRRFIAKTKNNEVNGGEVMFEENIRSNVACPDALKPIKIVPPLGRNVQADDNDGIEPIDCNVDEPGLPVLNDSHSSSNDYQTAGSSDSEAESASDQETPEPMIVNEPDILRTRSGRVSRPPQRYGWN